MKHKIVINVCYGGFELSDIAIKRYYEKKYPLTTLYFYKYEYDSGDYLGEFVTSYIKYDPEKEHNNIFILLTKDYGDNFTCKGFDSPYSNDEVLNYFPKRTDTNLIEVVEELGERASGSHSKLVVSDFEGEYYRIEDYDGYESVTTPDTENWEKV